MTGPLGPAHRVDPAHEAAARLAAVRERVAAAARAAGRQGEGIVLVAVSKNHPLAAVDALAALGVIDFGEARQQEGGPKAQARPELVWHFLGALQRNKAAAVGRWARVVHSLDREALVAPLGRGAAEAGRSIDVLVQVSLDGDPGRSGALVGDVPGVAAAVADQAGLRLAGVMAVAPQGAEPRPAFAELRRVSERLRAEHPAATVISAGMSGDLEQAVAEGATHLRVGTALFGPRA